MQPNQKFRRGAQMRTTTPSRAEVVGAAIGRLLMAPISALLYGARRAPYEAPTWREHCSGLGAIVVSVFLTILVMLTVIGYVHTLPFSSLPVVILGAAAYLRWHPTKMATEACELMIGDVVVPRENEPLSFVVFGSPGSGKTQIINRMMQTVRARGDMAIVADSGGEAMSALYRDGDVLLNPLDKRTFGTWDWSPFAEMTDPWDSDMIAKSIIPDKDGVEAEWAIFAQQLVSAVLRRGWENGKTTNRDFLHFLTIEKSENLEGLVAGLPAAALFDVGAARMLSSVRGIVSAHLGPYVYLNPDAGKTGFSIRRFVASSASSKDGAPWLWLPYRDGQSALLGPLLATQIDIANVALLDLDTDLYRRVWIFVDEYGSLPKINTAERLVSKGRKKGATLVGGIQTLAMLEQGYGPKGAQTMLACLQNWVALRTVDSQTARALQDLAGKRESVRHEESISDAGFLGERKRSVAVRHVTEDVLLASEFQNLPPCEGYLSLAGAHPIVPIDVPIVKLEQRIPAFVRREMAVMPPAPAPAKKAPVAAQEPAALPKLPEF